MQAAPIEAEAKPSRTPYVLLAVGCGVLFLVSLCCLPAAGYVFFLQPMSEGGGPAPAEPVFDLPEPPPTPVSSTDPSVAASRTVVVQITHVEGLPTPAVGSECRFDVERRSRRDGTFWCHTVVACGGRALFGSERYGYFDCTLYEGVQRHVVGEDGETTRESRDPAFRVDTLNQQFEVRDDASGAHGAFLLRGRVLRVE